MFRFFPFLVGFYFNILLDLKNAFKRVFIFLQNDQNNISYPKSEIAKFLNLKYSVSFDFEAGKTVLPQIFSVLPQFFFQIFFSLTHFQLRNGLAFSLYQQVQVIFL
jgi:hypothetical protein